MVPFFQLAQQVCPQGQQITELSRQAFCGHSSFEGIVGIIILKNFDMSSILGCFSYFKNQKAPNLGIFSGFSTFSELKWPFYPKGRIFCNADTCPQQEAVLHKWTLVILLFFTENHQKIFKKFFMELHQKPPRRVCPHILYFRKPIDISLFSRYNILK